MFFLQFSDKSAIEAQRTMRKILYVSIIFIILSCNEKIQKEIPSILARATLKNTK